MHPHRMVHRDITVWYFSGGTGPHAGAATPMIRSPAVGGRLLRLGAAKRPCPLPGRGASS